MLNLLFRNCAEFVILAGDFNSEPGSIPISILSQHLKDSRGLGSAQINSYLNSIPTAGVELI